MIFKYPLALIPIEAVVTKVIIATVKYRQSIVSWFNPIMSIAVGAKLNPITIIIGPTIIDGSNFLNQSLPKNLIANDTAT